MLCGSARVKFDWRDSPIIIVANDYDRNITFDVAKGEPDSLQPFRGAIDHDVVDGIIHVKAVHDWNWRLDAIFGVFRVEKVGVSVDGFVDDVQVGAVNRGSNREKASPSCAGKICRSRRVAASGNDASSSGI